MSRLDVKMKQMGNLKIEICCPVRHTLQNILLKLIRNYFLFEIRKSKSRISGLDLTEEKNMPCVQGPRYVGDHSNQLTKISEQNF